MLRRWMDAFRRFEFTHRLCSQESSGPGRSPPNPREQRQCVTSTAATSQNETFTFQKTGNFAFTAAKTCRFAYLFVRNNITIWVQLKMTEKGTVLQPVLQSQCLRMKPLWALTPPTLSSCLAMNYKVRRVRVLSIRNFKTSVATAVKQRKD